MRWPFSRSGKLADARPLYAAVVAEARDPFWYRNAGLPDSMDGRFRVLATLLALTDRRLGAGGEAAKALAPRLTETFVADMDVQMREAGFGDPSLGKQVQQLVGALAGRTERWRGMGEAGFDWDRAVADSLYAGNSEDGAAAARERLEQWRDRLDRATDAALDEGRL